MANPHKDVWKGVLCMVGSIGLGHSSYSDYTAYGKLASGNKLNRAADGAAELAISQKMETEQRTAAVQQRNAADNISQRNITDGRYSQALSTLQDMRANAVAAQNGTLSDSDKATYANANSQLYADMSQQLGSDAMKSMGLGNLNVNDLDSIDKAIESISSSASENGAATNGTEHMMNYNAVMRENLMAAESRLTDTDYGEEVVNLKKQQTLDKYRTMMQKDQMEQQARQNNIQNFMV